MTESELRRIGASGALRPARDFTAAIFAKIGVDRYVLAPSALGDVLIAWSADGVSAIRLAGDADAFEGWYAARFGRTVVPAVEDDAVSGAARAVLRGEERDVPIDLRACSPFERRVLFKAAEIERGNARPYGWVARELGTPDATRAVGNALARNPVPLLIPCHRVIRGDASIGGYVFGDAAKRALLESEGLDVGAVEALRRRGFRYVACDDGTFCLPTCGDIATRIDAPGYHGLRSVSEAVACGLEPCAQCRPVAA
jgi:O-6-methylguanine DNA methyltransferase